MSQELLVAVPRINPMFRFQWEPAQDCFVLLYPEGMVQLNGPAGEILQFVDGQRSVQEIIDALLEKYPGAEGLADDVVEFVNDARGQNWLTL